MAAMLSPSCRYPPRQPPPPVGGGVRCADGDGPQCSASSIRLLLSNHGAAFSRPANAPERGYGVRTNVPTPAAPFTLCSPPAQQNADTVPP